MSLHCPYCDEPIFDGADATLVGASHLHTECAERFDEEYQAAFERDDLADIDDLLWPQRREAYATLREDYLIDEADRDWREAA